MFILIYIGLGIVLNYLGIRGIFGGDSAEYSFIAHIWGIAHPPGYPLYSLLINLARIIFPFLSEYTRINMFSIVPGILTSYISYRTLFLLTKQRFVAFCTSLFFLFLYPVWLYSEVPEVFMLNVFLISLISYLVMLTKFKKTDKYVPFIGLLLGLAVAHHHTFIFFIPGWLYLLKNQYNSLKSRGKIFIIMLLMGASVYAYVPIASLFNPPLDIENTKTLSGFLNLFFRTSYGTFRAYSGSTPNILNQGYNILSLVLFILHDFKPIGLVFIVAGFIHLLKRNAIFFRFYLILTVSYIFFIFLTNFLLNSPFTIATFERFLIALYYVLLFPMAFGIVAFTEFYKPFILRYVNNKIIRIISLTIPTVLIGGMVIVNFTQSYKYIKVLRNIQYFDTYAKNLLDTADNGSIVSIQGDTEAFSTAYYYYAKNYRKDLQYFNLTLLQKNSYSEKIKKEFPELKYTQLDSKTVARFLIDNSKKQSIFSNQPLSLGVWMPYGLLWKYYNSEEEVAKDADNLIRKNVELWSRYNIPMPSPEEKNILYVENLHDHYISMYNAFGLILAQREEYGKATHVFQEILRKYNPSHTDSATSLIEIGFIKQASCLSIQKYVGVLIKNKDKLTKDDYASLLRYFNKCDQKNPLVDEYIQDYKLLLKPKDVPLEKL